MLFIVAALIFIPSNSAHDFLFLHILATLVISWLSDNSHSNRCKMISHCGFDLHFQSQSVALPARKGFPWEHAGDWEGAVAFIMVCVLAWVLVT